MLLPKCQTLLWHRYLTRNSSPYIPIAARLVTNLSALRSLDARSSSKCAINQLNSQLNSLIHQYNDRPAADRSPTVKPTASEQHSASSSLPTRLEKQQFKLSDLISVFYLLNLNMETDNLVNSLRKAFKNENVNEIMGLHGRMMSPTSVGKTGKQFSFENFSNNQPQQKTQFKKSELLDSSILSKVKHVYHNTLNRLRFCSYHLKVRTFCDRKTFSSDPN